MDKKLLMLVAFFLLPVAVIAGSFLPGLQGVPHPDALAAPAYLAEDDLLSALEARLQQIYKEVNPSVVNIQITQNAASAMPGLPFGHESIPEGTVPELPQMPLQGVGSGFVWDGEGHIVTNNHVVDGAEKIRVTFHDDTTVLAEVVGTDPHSDLAVLKVDVPAGLLRPVTLADSTAVKVGEIAFAIGNPFGLEGTMTVGFISALGRSLPVSSGARMFVPSYTIPDIIQTDAPINPGNSGGVLVDDLAQVIGVPTAIESPVGANAGIGFAVPSVIVEKVVPVLIAEGSYEHPWLGISGTTLGFELAEAMGFGADQRGVLISEVVVDSPSEQAGLRGADEQVQIEGFDVGVGGDVIVGIDDVAVQKFNGLVTYLARSTEVGQTVTLTILRDGEEETVAVTLAARPAVEERFEPPAPRGALPGTGTHPGTGGWLGIQGLTLSPEIAEAMELPSGQAGILVAEVIQATPADEAGLLGGGQMVDVDGRQVPVGGDIITAIDGEPVTRFEELRAVLLQSEPGQEVTLTIVRGDEELQVEVTLGERPADMP